jgi:6-phosphogluconolactonase
MERKRNYIYPDKDSLVAAFVCEFARYLKANAEQGGKLHIALSGGSTPLAVFSQLAQQTSREEWSGVHLYWGDERCVPPDHPESNYGNTKKFLLEALDLDQEQIHRIRGEEKPYGEADRYGQLLLKQMSLADGFPVFDWIWLGLGRDGHTASIFPKHIELWTAGSPCIVTNHPVSGQPRISLSGGVINAAKRVSFIASGREKAEVIKEIFLKEGRYMEYPAFYVHPVSGNLEWYLDQDAIHLL